MLKTQYVDLKTIPEMSIAFQEADENAYYIYGKGHLQNICLKVNEAVRKADEQVGVVLNSRQQYIWERGNVKNSVKLEIAEVPEGILTAPIDEASVQQALGGDYLVLNLTGCSLSSIRYQISNGYPVIAKFSADETVVIVGYDVYNIWVYDPASQGMRAIALDEAEPLLAAQGNVFVSYRANQIG